MYYHHMLMIPSQPSIFQHGRLERYHKHMMIIYVVFYEVDDIKT